MVLLHTWKPVCLSFGLLLLVVTPGQSGFIQHTTVKAIPLQYLENKNVVPVESKVKGSEEKLFLSGPYGLPTPEPKVDKNSQLDRQEDLGTTSEDDITTISEASTAASSVASAAASSTASTASSLVPSTAALTVASTAASSVAPTPSKGGMNSNGFIDWTPYSQIMPEDLDQTPVATGKVKIFNIRADYLLPKIPIPNEDENMTSTADRVENEEIEDNINDEIYDYIDDINEIEERVHSRKKRGTTAYNSDLAGCGGTFRNLYGIIESPQFPLYYPRNKECLYDIEVPNENHTVKVTCDVFTLQGGNCTFDYLLVSPSGNSSFPDEERYCGAVPPVIKSTTNKLLIKFITDDLFRYQGFSCRYRAIQPNGIAVPGTFGNTTENAKNTLANTNFLQTVQCPQVGPAVSTEGTDGTTKEESTMGTSMYSGLWNGMCGNQNDAPSGRIVGGWASIEHQFPWMAAVLRTCGSEYCHICGATIISEEWILTGAHCMATVAKEDLGVLVGDHDLFSVSNDQKFIRVKEKVIHPDYNYPTPLNNDIGLLRLENPIVFTKYIAPLCLPALGETGFEDNLVVNKSMLDTTGLSIVGQNATVLGWGMINDAKVYAEGLRGVQVEILDNDVCNKLYGIMTENMMCTSGNNGRGTCYGDSGGPAVVQSTDGTYVQVGILAFGALAGCELGYPSGQVLVHKYIDWIQAITGIAFGAQFG